MEYGNVGIVCYNCYVIIQYFKYSNIIAHEKKNIQGIWTAKYSNTIFKFESFWKHELQRYFYFEFGIGRYQNEYKIKGLHSIR